MAHHHHFHARRARDGRGLQARQEVGTVVSVVYVTAAPTFDGPIAGYTTIAPNPQQAQQPAGSRPLSRPPPIAAQFPSNEDSNGDDGQEAQSLNPSISQAAQPSDNADSVEIIRPTQVSEASAIGAPSSSGSPELSLEAASSSESSELSLEAASPSESPELVPSAETTPLLSTKPIIPTPTSESTGSVTAVSATTAATPQSTQATSPSGTSPGAKAGIAFGVLLGLGFIVALAIFFYSRKKKQQKGYGSTDDEKTSSGDGVAFGAGRPASTRTARTASTAPRLSLRPQTEFLPNIGGEGRGAGNQLAVASNPAMTGAATSSQWKMAPGIAQPSQTLAQADNPANPFGNQAERSDPSLAPVQTHNAAAVELGKGSDLHHKQMTDFSAPGNTMDASPATGDVMGGTAVPQQHSHETSPDHAGHSNNSTSNIERPTTPEATGLDPRGQPSPTGTDFSTTSSMPAMSMTSQVAGAAGLPGGAGASSVHRVQLDFKPSMEDELELRAGQLVRLLHEYDDGWALCIRLDRSQQGVAPRTCLSTRPVKPRPTNGGQQARPGPPRGGPPPGMRVPPQGGPPMMRAPMMRPSSPANGRQSPRPYGQAGRPASPSRGRQSPRPYAGQQGRPQSPAGPAFAPYVQQAPRSMSPSGGRQSPRPSPAGGPPRAMSPAHGNRSRSNSAAASTAGPRSPPGPSRMNPNAYQGERGMTQGGPGPTSPTGSRAGVGRKPVPGQAM